MEREQKANGPVRIKHVNGETAVFLGDIPITNHCLSCDIRIEAGVARGTVTMLLDEIKIDVRGEATGKTRAGNQGYLEFCQD